KEPAGSESTEIVLSPMYRRQRIPSRLNARRWLTISSTVESPLNLHGAFDLLGYRSDGRLKGFERLPQIRSRGRRSAYTPVFLFRFQKLLNPPHPCCETGVLTRIGSFDGRRTRNRAADPGLVSSHVLVVSQNDFMN